MCPHIQGLWRATVRHHSLTSNLLLNWALSLSTASKLHFCCRDAFPLPHPRGCCLDRLPTDCLAAAVIEQGCGASLRPRGAIGCIPNGRAACVWRALDESAISEWEGGKPRTTLHYRDQTFSAAAWRSFVSAPQASAVNLNVIVHQS